MASHADRNLLFGIVALQMDFITRPQLMQAMHAAIGVKDKSLGEILLEQGVLSAGRRSLLEALVQEQLKQHGGDPQQSLAALSPRAPVGKNGVARSIRAELRQIPDADLQASLAQVTTDNVSSDDDSAATRAGMVAAPAGVGERFRILRPHAEGGLGKVSVALDTELHREVALKEIKERHADHPESRARFMIEAEITGGLEHPGIVPIYALGTYADGRLFYAMRFIRGDSLKEAIERYHGKPLADNTTSTDKNRSATVPAVFGAADFSSLDFRKLLGRFIDVCNAVAYAHSRGVLHRDLKPGNVMLGKYGETLVVDWGLAKAAGNWHTADGSSSHGSLTASTTGSGPLEAPLLPASGSGSAETVAGSAIGTPQFMSPEQAAGRLDLLGPASDVYSLGATLYCLLTGRSPIEDQDIGAVLGKVQKGDFPPPRAVNAKIPAALEAICLRAMALRLEDRYRTPRDLADDVERWLADERVQAYQEPLTARLGRWARRHRTLVSAAAGLLLASAILLGVSTETFRVLHKEADKLRNDADQALRAGQRSAYVNAIRLANEHWQDAVLKDIPELLANAGPLELRSWEWGHLNHLMRGPTRSLLFPKRTTAFALNPDDTRMATGASDGTITVWDVAAGRERFSVAVGNNPAIAFSGDGKRLVAASVTVNPENGKDTWTEIKSWQVDDGRAQGAKSLQRIRKPLAMSPDATLLVGCDAAGKAKLWNAATGTELFTLGDGPPGTAFAFSADGQWFASGGKRTAGDDVARQGQLGEVIVWEIATGKKLIALSDQWYRVQALAFHPTKRELAVGTENGLLTRWELATGTASKRPIWEHTGAIQCLAYCRDGSWLASGGVDRRVTLVNLADVSENVRSLRGHFSEVNGLAFDVTSKQLISAGTAINYWDLTKSVNFVEAHGGATRIAFDPNGAKLACADANDVRLVNMDTGQEVRKLDRAVSDSKVLAIAFNPKGDRLAAGWADGTVSLQNPAGGPPLKFRGHQGPVHRVTFSPAANGPLASAGLDGLVKLWDSSGRELVSIPAVPDAQAGLAFSPDGKRLAIGSADGVRLCDPISGREEAVLTAKEGAARAIAFQPQGSIVATVHSDNLQSQIKLWDWRSGEQLPSLRGSLGDIATIAFTPDGRRLVTGSHQGRIKLWDVVCGHEVFEINLLALLQKQCAVLDLAFSRDGLTLAATTGDDVLLWNAMPWDDAHPSAKR